MNGYLDILKEAGFVDAIAENKTELFVNVLNKELKLLEENKTSFQQVEFLSKFVFVCFFLFIVFISLGTPTFEWDARSIWLFHAKRIFYDKSIFSVFSFTCVLANCK